MIAEVIFLDESPRCCWRRPGWSTQTALHARQVFARATRFDLACLQKKARNKKKFFRGLYSTLGPVYMEKSCPG